MQSNRKPLLGDGYQRRRHAHYSEDRVMYHVVFKTAQSFFLLRPDRQGRLKGVCAGVLARAKRKFPCVALHAAVVMSNHVHLALSSNEAKIPEFVGYFKRHLSFRWGPKVKWRGIFEEGYHFSATLTPKGELNVMKYILSQSVKEGLVDDPRRWPGLHCAQALAEGKGVRGVWFEGTTFGHANQRWRRKEERRREREGRTGRKELVNAPPRRADFFADEHLKFDPIPSLSHLGPQAYQQEILRLIAEIKQEGETHRGRRRVQGLRVVTTVTTRKKGRATKLPWFEDRRPMIVWDSPTATEVKAYLRRYSVFQDAFRKATDEWLKGNLRAKFPARAYRPGGRRTPALLS